MNRREGHGHTVIKPLQKYPDVRARQSGPKSIRTTRSFFVGDIRLMFYRASDSKREAIWLPTIDGIRIRCGVESVDKRAGSTVLRSRPAKMAQT